MVKKNKQTILHLIYELRKHLSSERKWQLWLVLILMIVSSAAEIVSIGLVVPFLAILSDPTIATTHDFISPIFKVFNLNTTNEIVVPLTLAFIAAIIFSALIRIFLLYTSTRLSFATGSDLSVKIYKSALYQPYDIHIERNTSEVINGVINKTDDVVGGVFNPLLTLFSVGILLLSIFGLLLFINPYTTLISLFVFGFIYWFILFFTQKKLKKNSYIISLKSTKMVKSLQEGLGGIRDIILDNSQEYFVNNYYHFDKSFRDAHGSNVFISGSPRYIVEAIGVVTIVLIAYFISQDEGGLSEVMPILGAVALGAQKILPAIQQAYKSVSGILGSQASLIDVLNFLNSDNSTNIYKTESLRFDKSITLNNVSFKYKNSIAWIFQDFNIEITKGSCVGFMGETGSGKSTLLDIIMGLLHPNDGGMLVDGRHIDNTNVKEWQSKIAHVPQNIYLSDSTIMENIAFGVNVNDIDIALVKEVSKRACIYNMIESLPDKYDSYVGELGVSLSGGQVQRIGIARALYKQSDVLILDEATSALDQKTQDDVMLSILQTKKDITLLIIAHRIDTLKRCDKVVTLSNGLIDKVEYSK